MSTLFQGLTNSSAANAAAQTVEGIADAVGRTAHTVAEDGREAGERLMEATDNITSAVVSSVKAQPLAALLVTAGIGFLIGALWKS